MENNNLVWSLSVTEAKFSYVSFLLDSKVWTLLGNTSSFIFAYGNQKLLLAVRSWPVAAKVAQALGTANMMIALQLYYKSLYGNITPRLVQNKGKIITSTKKWKFFLFRSFKHQKIRKEWNMPIHCHFWYNSEYQLEKNLIKHVVFSALSKNVSPPFQWQSPSAVRGSFVKKWHKFYWDEKWCFSMIQTDF